MLPTLESQNLLKQPLTVMTEEQLPVVLYHCSGYLTEPLMPGIRHTGVLVRWDGNESNKFLYAVTDKEAAVDMGFASAVEKHFLLDHFVSDNATLKLTISVRRGQKVTIDDLAKLDLYLYFITPKPEDGWIHNHNKRNHLVGEYKTQRDVYGAKSQKVDLRRWLSKQHVEIVLNEQV